MPGFMWVLGYCYTCNAQIQFNPNLVPSVPAHLTTTGTKEPVCRPCIERANPERAKSGLPPIVILNGAYDPEPCP